MLKPRGFRESNCQGSSTQASEPEGSHGHGLGNGGLRGLGKPCPTQEQRILLSWTVVFLSPYALWSKWQPLSLQDLKSPEDSLHVWCLESDCSAVESWHPDLGQVTSP